MNALRPIRICLYVAVSPEMEYRPMPAPLLGRIKAATGRGLDIANWFVFRGTNIRFHHWNTLEVTNKGDIAIREAVKEQLSSLFAPQPVEFTLFGWETLDPVTACDVSREHDLFVIAGSGYIFSDNSGELHRRASSDRAFLQNISCPKIAYGIGWNKLLSGAGLNEERPLTPEAQNILKDIFGHLDLVSVRDRATHDLLGNLTGSPPSTVGDPALFYRGAGPSAAIRRQGKIRVGLNFALHGQTSSRRIAAQHELYCALLREFSQKHDVSYHYVQHTHTERVVPMLLKSRGINVETVDVPPEQLPGFYQTLDLHICQMLHSAILAVSADVPTLHFAYDVKSLGFFELMEMPQYCLPSQPFDSQGALSALEALLADAAAVRSHIVRRKEEIRQVCDSFYDEIKMLVTRNG